MTSALARIHSQIKAPSFARLLDDAAPEHMRGQDLAARVAYSVMYSMGQNKRLMACTPDSIRKCAIDAVTLGLIPGGPLGQAYLVPYGREASIIIGYRGMIELARRGRVATVEARCVYDGDTFEVALGSHPRIIHSPSYRDRGEVYAVYAIATMVYGPKQSEVMTREEIEAVRSRSRAKDSGPWVTDWAEMAKKTVVRRLCKYLPMSIDMARAIEIDARTEYGAAEVVDVEVTPPQDQTDTLLSMMQAADYPEAEEPDHGRYADLAAECDKQASIAVQKHGRDAVDMALKALELPPEAEWREAEYTLAIEGYAALASGQAPTADTLSEWVDMIHVRLDA